MSPRLAARNVINPFVSEVYYNEFDDFAASWLRELIADGLIPKGQVDQRSVLDVEASDLKDFEQCHFFAGIGGWAYAARLAQWPADRPIWTGSPPCQPFSVAGKQEGAEDKRHLWPVWFDLIRELKPPTIFGEQVSAAVRHGWLDQIQADLEDSDYAVGSVIVPASGVGALHKRDRLWFVAYCRSNGSQGWLSGRQDQEREVQRRQARCGSTADSVAYSDNAGQRADGRPVQEDQRDNPWGSCEAVQCKDGKVRLIPTEPEIFPLADGIPNRVGTLRGAGNAIVPQVAAEIMKAFI